MTPTGPGGPGPGLARGLGPGLGPGLWTTADAHCRGRLPSKKGPHYRRVGVMRARARQHLHLVWHNGAILDDPEGLLEGAYPDRRMTYFTGLADVEAKRAALEGLVRRWVELMDRDG